MSVFDSKIWIIIKKNKLLYFLIHNTLGRWLSNYQLKDRKDTIKEFGLDSILEVDDLLASNGVLFYVDFGTLLGFVRSGTILPWDYDIDFGIHLTKDFSWNELESLMNSKEFKLLKQFEYEGIVTEQTYTRGEVYIDFFNHFSDEESSYYYVYYQKEDFDYPNELEMHARITKTRVIDNNKELPIEGGTIHVPKDAEGYLEDVYGSDWRTPQKNWKPTSFDNIVFMPHMGKMTLFE